MRKTAYDCLANALFVHSSHCCALQQTFHAKLVDRPVCTIFFRTISCE